ncbi:MAG: dTDP-4-dehydrorhamnose 3,5-epimerase [Fusobacteriaceae bacterium]
MGKFNRVETGIQDLIVIEPTIFGDNRGFFLESYSQKDFLEIGMDVIFVQDNHSKSKKGVLRGLHFQTQHVQGKLVRVTAGAVLDVVVDLRDGSPTFGKHYLVELTAQNKKMFYIPPGFAHGFLTLEDDTEFQYKCTDYYAPEFDSGILWNDSEVGINWNFQKYGLSKNEILLSEKDKQQQTLAEFKKSGVVIG